MGRVSNIVLITACSTLCVSVTGSENRVDTAEIAMPSTGPTASSQANGPDTIVTQAHLSLDVSANRLRKPASRELRLPALRLGKRWYFGRDPIATANVGFVFRMNKRETITIGSKGIQWSRRL
ncbi:MAG: hypothetical protein VB933_00515 [Pseudomonadales bacterium]